MLDANCGNTTGAICKENEGQYHYNLATQGQLDLAYKCGNKRSPSTRAGKSQEVSLA